MFVAPGCDLVHSTTFNIQKDVVTFLAQSGLYIKIPLSVRPSVISVCSLFTNLHLHNSNMYVTATLTSLQLHDSVITYDDSYSHQFAAAEYVLDGGG